MREYNSVDEGKWFAAKVLRESAKLSSSASLVKQCIDVPVVPAECFKLDMVELCRE